MRSTALRQPSNERPLRAVPKPEPDCTAWLRDKLSSGPCWLGGLPTEWMHAKRLSHSEALEQFLEAQQAIGARGCFDEKTGKFVLVSREEWRKREEML